MRDAFPPTPDGLAAHGITCQHCQRRITLSITGLFRQPERGSQQRFCSPACRQAAYRRRRAGAPETLPDQTRGGRNRTLKQQDH